MHDRSMFIREVKNGYLLENPTEGTIIVVETKDLTKVKEVIDNHFRILTEEEAKAEKEALKAELLRSMPDAGREEVQADLPLNK